MHEMAVHMVAQEDHDAKDLKKVHHDDQQSLGRCRAWPCVHSVCPLVVVVVQMCRGRSSVVVFIPSKPKHCDWHRPGSVNYARCLPLQVYQLHPSPKKNSYQDLQFVTILEIPGGSVTNRPVKGQIRDSKEVTN